MSLPDMIEWAKEHPDRAAIRIAELETENAALLRLVVGLEQHIHKHIPRKPFNARNDIEAVWIQDARKEAQP